MRTYPTVGLQVPNVLLPKRSMDFEKWSVVACDQFTSQPEYWKTVEQFIGDDPSTYYLILPEAFLGTEKGETHQTAVENFMHQFFEHKFFRNIEGLIFVERKIESGTRKGLMAALDLEKYDFSENSTSLIRATEGTIVDRLPPRIEIREKAPLETPHIMVFIDDPDFSVIERISDQCSGFEHLYDFELMMGGGHISSYKVGEPIVEEIVSALENLANPVLQKEKYHSESSSTPLLFAIGDGNHSLATAKSVWEKVKRTVRQDHPARYALVEIVNIHDPAIIFKPIHRILIHTKQVMPEKVLGYFGENCTVDEVYDFQNLQDMVENQNDSSQKFGILNSDGYHLVELTNPPHTLAAGSIQLFLDEMIQQKAASEIDYIHGDETIQELSSHSRNTGFYLPVMNKHRLFESVIKDGPLPRKTFSMGEAHQKRYYLECRRIK